MTHLHTRSLRLSTDILRDIRAALDDALAKGQTLRTFHDNIEPLLQAKGWWGRKLLEDPADAPGAGPRIVQLGSARRLRIIFDTNLRTSYAAGRWERIQRVKEARPYLRYVAIKDSRTRQQHLAWHGIVLPVDHPFWDTHYPPNGWGCRCIVQQLSAADLEEFGLKVNEQGPSGYRQTLPWHNKRTGQNIQVPRGIDPGFAHNVGKLAADSPSFESGFKGMMGQEYADRLGEVLARMSAGNIRRPRGATDPELVALDAYTNSDTATPWNGLALNAALRSSDRADVLLASNWKVTLNAALSKLPDYRGRVARRTDLPEAVLAEYKVGATRPHKDFTSASIGATPGFTAGRPHLFVIESKHGKRIQDYSRHPHQQEVLFPADTRFHVRNVEIHKGETIVKMEEAD